MSRTAVLNNKFIPSDFLPIGFLGYLPYSAVPAGWLICDGTVYNVADYPELAAKLGSTYGGDGVTTFAVPDDRGLFRRGLDLSKGYDSGRVLGSEQGDELKSHKHTFGPYAGILGTGASGYSFNSGSSYMDTGLTGGSETRPKNRAYVPIIKAKNIYYDMTVQGGNAASLGGNPASYYAANSLAVKYTDFTGTFATNGYRRLPDGTILQWGVATIPSGSYTTVTFPITFSTEAYVAFCISRSSICRASTYQLTVANVQLYQDSGATLALNWQAIGK